jgi:hypothetical protein
MSDLIHTLTVETLREFMQGAGYRAESIIDPVTSIAFLRSATNGLSFDIRMGNPVAGDKNAYSDAALLAVFNIVGDLPLAPINAWNNSRRFCRLQIDKNNPDQSFLVLCMDLVVAGGVTQLYLRNQIEIWDGLVQQLVPWLRDELAKLRPVNVAQPAVPVAVEHAEARDPAAAAGE